MMKNKLLQVSFCFQLFLCTTSAFGDSCAEVTIESAFAESHAVLILENLSNKLTKSQFVESYLSERKHLKGFEKNEQKRKASYEWDKYNARVPRSHFLVRSNLKGNLNVGSVADLIVTQQISFDIGKTYILFLAVDSQRKNSLFVDSCLFFNLTDKVFIKRDKRLAGPKSFEAAMENLMDRYYVSISPTGISLD